MFIKTSRASRLAVVETERMADWELARIHSLDSKRVWK